MNSQDFSRRGFLAASAAATALTASGSKAAAGPVSPNGRLRLGFIGLGGRATYTHIPSAATLQNRGKVEIATVCDVFNRYVRETVDQVKKLTGATPKTTGDYRDIINDPSIDAVVISTPDHWHAVQTQEALAAGKHVYCEKPMTHTVEEALAVHKAWLDSGKVMQVGVQSTSLPVWDEINQRITTGGLGKLMQYQTSYYRNSSMGQWRYYKLTRDMTPSNIDWKMFLGSEQGLAPEMPFDRAVFAQWRCYWEFGSGMLTDLFVHRTTSMLKATGLRFPGRVVGAGGIFLEYDGRSVPDVATVAADFPEGVQGLVTATMCCEETPVPQIIRGHHGSIFLGNDEQFTGYNFVAERPQVTEDSSIKDARIEVGQVPNTSLAHLENFADACLNDDPGMVNCSPELGAAAMLIVKLGARSYREGKVFHFDPESMTVGEGDGSWAKRWEEMSTERADPMHVPGWAAGDTGSKLVPRDYQKLGGPWVDGADPAGST